jgi:hypothetical protein
MKETIKKELASHILDMIQDNVITDYNIEDWHHLCFNEDYYIIGYYQAEQWLKRHNLSAFKAINICQEYEKENFGEIDIYDNAEVTVNMLAYIYGYDLLNEVGAETIEDLKEKLETI